MFHLRGKTALVTGPTDGIDRATFIASAPRATHVLEFGRDELRANRVFADIKSSGANVAFRLTTLSSRSSRSSRPLAGDGHVDILIKNADVALMERSTQPRKQSSTRPLL